MNTQILGTLALIYGLGAAVTVLMQARQVLATGSSCDVSARFFATYAGGYAVWLLYGLALGSMPIIVVHAVGLVCGAMTLFVTLQARGSLRRPSTWRPCAEARQAARSGALRGAAEAPGT